jgi:hypothetical protein
VYSRIFCLGRGVTFICRCSAEACASSTAVYLTVGVINKEQNYHTIEFPVPAATDPSTAPAERRRKASYLNISTGYSPNSILFSHRTLRHSSPRATCSPRPDVRSVSGDERGTRPASMDYIGMKQKEYEAIGTKEMPVVACLWVGSRTLRTILLRRGLESIVSPTVKRDPAVSPYVKIPMSRTRPL